MVAPKLRFKEFDGDWNSSVLVNISQIITGSTPPTSKREYYDGEFLFVSPADIQENRYVETTKTTLTVEGFNKCRHIPENSILFVCIGSTIGKVAQNKVACATNQQINAVIPNKGYSSDFLYLQLEKLAPNIKLTAGVQAVPLINKTEFGKTVLNTPTFKEQTKIASFLSAVDEKISQLNRKHELLSQYKQGMMQKLFSQQIRFKADDGSEFGEWVEWKFESCIDIFDNLRKPVSASERKTGSTPYYGANGIQSYIDGYTHDGEFILIAEDGANDLINYPIQYVNGKIWVNNHAHVVCGKTKIAKNIFLKYRLGLIDFTKYLVGGGRAKLNAGAMKEISLLLPCLAEQTKIANFLTAIDQKIEVVAQQIEQAKQWKKGLLQQMFV